MATRVGVVGLDDVSEEERRAPVGVAELERVVDPAVALAREEGEEREQRDDEQDRERLVVSDHGEEEPGRGERRVHEVDGGGHPELGPEGDVECHPGPHRRAGEVEGELREEHPSEERQDLPRGSGLAGNRKHKRGPEGVPRAEDLQQRALPVDASARELARRAEQEADGDAERHERHWEQEEHGHEDDLRGDREPGADLELDARCEGVRDDEHEEHPRLDDPVRGREEGERDCHGDERQGTEERGARVSRRQPFGRARTRVLDEPAGLGIEVGRGGRRHGHPSGVSGLRYTRKSLEGVINAVHPDEGWHATWPSQH